MTGDSIEIRASVCPIPVKLCFLFAGAIFVFLQFSACFRESDPALPLSSQGEDSQDPASKDMPQEEDSFCHSVERPFCWQDPTCIAFCEKVFFLQEERENCRNRPLAMVRSFEELWETLRTGLFQHIDPEVFSCFLDMTKNKNIFFRGFSDEEVKELLREMAGNSDSMRAVSRKGRDGFPILDALLRKLKRTAVRAIAEPLTFGRDNNFLISALENENRPALVYLNDYLIHKCRRDSDCSEPLDYYCKILKNIERSTWRNFFQENDLFRRNYVSAIESKTCGRANCEYGDFDDWERLCKAL